MARLAEKDRRITALESQLATMSESQVFPRKVEILGRLYFIEIPQVRCILSHAMMSLLLT